VAYLKQAKAMSDSKNQTRYKGLDRRAARTEPPAVRTDTAPAADAYVNLLKRGEKIGGRHSAITNTLYNWHSYTSWADKMRGSWEDKK
jgi:hypothetical protein